MARRGRKNIQCGNVGNLGDILKHAALVRLAQLIANRKQGQPVNYLDTHTFLLHAPLCDQGEFELECSRLLAKHKAYKDYVDIESAALCETGEYWCSTRLAIHCLPSADLYLAESDPDTRTMLSHQLADIGVTPCMLLTDMMAFRTMGSVPGPQAVLALVDPFFKSREQLLEIWEAACAGVSTLRDQEADGIIELFEWRNGRPFWPDAPEGFLGPIATIDREKYHLAVYATDGISQQVATLLGELGWQNPQKTRERNVHTMQSSARNAKAKQIVHVLAAKRQRATYGAVGGCIGDIARNVGMRVGTPSRTNSWVVSAETGEPTGYERCNIDPELLARLDEHVINDTEELKEFLGKHGLDCDEWY